MRPWKKDSDDWLLKWKVYIMYIPVHQVWVRKIVLYVYMDGNISGRLGLLSSNSSADSDAITNFTLSGN